MITQAFFVGPPAETGYTFWRQKVYKQSSAAQ